MPVQLSTVPTIRTQLSLLALGIRLDWSHQRVPISQHTIISPVNWIVRRLKSTGHGCVPLLAVEELRFSRICGRKKKEKKIEQSSCDRAFSFSTGEGSLSKDGMAYESSEHRAEGRKVEEWGHETMRQVHWAFGFPPRVLLGRRPSRESALTLWSEVTDRHLQERIPWRWSRFVFRKIENTNTCSCY